MQDHCLQGALYNVESDWSFLPFHRVYLEGLTGPFAAPLGLRAFPNPTERCVTVEYAMKHADPVVVRILDASGREMQSYQPPRAGSGSLSIDLDGLAMGPFLIEAGPKRETWLLRAIKL